MASLQRAWRQVAMDARELTLIFPPTVLSVQWNFSQAVGRGSAWIGINASFYVKSIIRNEQGTQKYVGYKF